MKKGYLYLKNAGLCFLLVQALFSFQCKSEGEIEYLSPGTYDRVLTVDGRNRTFRLHVPSGYDRQSSLALVIALHGGGGTGSEMEQLTGFSRLADEKLFLVAYPNGYEDNHWADGRGTTLPDQHGVDDVHFISELISEVSRLVGVDTGRVYACGFSNGSMMTNLLACQLSDRLAAVGGASGQLAENKKNLIPASPVGMIYFHGTVDPVVPYNGGEVLGPNGGRVISVEELMLYWVIADQTQTVPTVTLLPDLDPGDGTRVIHYACVGGLSGTEVHLYRVEGGGHTWPGSNSPGQVTHDIDATESMWNFFETQSRK